MSVKPHLRCAPLTHLGDMPVETFIAEYWHKKPLLIRQAFRDWQPPLDAAELAGLACEDEVESRLIVENPHTGQWQLEPGPFPEHRFADLPESHWTLLVQGVDHWLPAAARLLQRFYFIPGWRLDDLMISYATQGGGVGPHYDNYDVFLLQAEGQRRWEVGGHYNEDSPIEAGKPVRILSDWQPEQSWVLEPGDMLYLPPQIGHNGVAETDDCVTYSIGYRAPQQGEMLRHFAEFCDQQLLDSERYADADLSLRHSSGEVCRSDIERVRAVMRRFIEDEELLAEWFGRLVTEAKYPHFSPLQGGLVVAQDSADSEDLHSLLSRSAFWHRTEGVRLAYWQNREQIKLFLDAEVIACTPALLPLVRLLCDEWLMAADQLKAAMAGAEPQAQAEAACLFATLVSNDVLYGMDDDD